jgi:hypothetical protein
MGINPAATFPSKTDMELIAWIKEAPNSKSQISNKSQ